MVNYSTLYLAYIFSFPSLSLLEYFILLTRLLLTLQTVRPKIKTSDLQLAGRGKDHTSTIRLRTHRYCCFSSLCTTKPLLFSSSSSSLPLSLSLSPSLSSVLCPPCLSLWFVNYFLLLYLFRFTSVSPFRYLQKKDTLS